MPTKMTDALVLTLVRSRPGLCTAELHRAAQAHGLSRADVERALLRLRRDGQVRDAGEPGGWHRWVENLEVPLW